jgi:CopG family nickel-responsive transcriptional regulator
MTEVAGNTANGACQEGIGSLSYVYDHHDRMVADRIMEAQHDHHDLIVSTTHAHLNHDNCLEICILRGRRQDIESLADRIIGLKGLRHGRLHLVSTGGHRRHTQSESGHSDEMRA